MLPSLLQESFASFQRRLGISRCSILLGLCGVLSYISTLLPSLLQESFVSFQRRLGISRCSILLRLVECCLISLHASILVARIICELPSLHCFHPCCKNHLRASISTLLPSLLQESFASFHLYIASILVARIICQLPSLHCFHPCCKNHLRASKEDSGSQDVVFF
jgi:hypothetical protein